MTEFADFLKRRADASYKEGMEAFPDLLMKFVVDNATPEDVECALSELYRMKQVSGDKDRFSVEHMLYWSLSGLLEDVMFHWNKKQGNTGV